MQALLAARRFSEAKQTLAQAMRRSPADPVLTRLERQAAIEEEAYAAGAAGAEADPK